MEIIDFDRKGHLVRFYLGEKDLKWGWTNPNYKNRYGGTPDYLTPSDTYGGDDWDDTPYEHNAGTVYDYYMKGYKDVVFNFTDILMEPCDGQLNSNYCKDDFIKRVVPCLIAIPVRIWEKYDSEIPYEKLCDYTYWANEVTDPEVKKYYFGDEVTEYNPCDVDFFLERGVYY